MAIQYSAGTLVNTTFVPTTRADIVNNITSNLSTAGWTTISGTPGSGSDVTMETALSNASGKVRFRFFDPGSGNCAQITMKHSSGSPTTQIAYCLPSNTWRIVANKYHFFAFMTGSANRKAARGAVMGGQLYTPSFISISANDAVAFMSFIGSTDTDATSHSTFRVTLRGYDGSNQQYYSGLFGSALVDGTALTSTAGALTIPVFQGGSTAAVDQGYRWEDSSLLAYEPLVGWATGNAQTNDCKLKGQLYDAMVVNGSWTGEQIISYDNHTWIAITDQATATLSATATLFVAVT